MKKSRAFLLLVPALLASCSRSPQDLSGTAVIGTTADFDSFNELNASDSEALQVIQHMLFLSLTKLDEHLQFVPDLATSWEFGPGDTILTYHLRPDVFWTDGVRTTAEDVVFTYQLAVDPAVAYPAIDRFSETSRVVAINDTTVRFHFRRAYADALSDTQIPILPKHILERVPREAIGSSEFNRNPIGNGPFKLMEWIANQQLVFAANDNCALGRPRLDYVIFRIVPDESTLIANLMAGSMDVVVALSPVAYKELQSDTRVRTMRFPGKSYAFVGWNLNRPVFSRAVRQALTQGINKAEIVNTLLEGFGRPAKGPLLPLVWAYDPTLQDWTFSRENARMLLEQEGWKDSDNDGILDKQGQKLEFSLKANAESQLRRDMAVMVQAQLKQIGVQVNIEVLEWNLFLDQVFQEKNFDAALSAWDADFTVNPAPLWHSSAMTSGYNFVSYQNERVDELLEEGRREVNRHLATPIWHEFQSVIVQDCPYTFLFSQDNLAAVHPRMNNVTMDVRGHLVNVREWWIEGAR